ncbi:MAG: patatin-like phospholipase family protein [Bacteroidia bacterium]|nr:patatin-like phospholipase family protein [Bacteroidia bacterium]
MKVEINLTLSGGGMKGVAHVALLEKLNELSVTPKSIAGSSSGALVAALYASGMKIRDILSFFKSTPLFKVAYMATGKPGFFDSWRYRSVLESFLPTTFEDLKLPIFIAATNLQDCKVQYFNSGELITPLIASCALPPIYSPVLIENQWFADGGIIDNYPLQPFLKKEEFLLGSYVVIPSVRPKESLNNTLKVSNHASSLLLHAANEHKFDLADQSIIFPIGKFRSFDSSQVDDIYKAAKDHLDHLEEELLKNLGKTVSPKIS